MATVLIIEDHAMSRQVLHILLEHMGHRVLEAVDGNTALALARSEHPDLIISDILLPGIDGLKLVQLRAETLPRQTPVIFIPPPAASGGPAPGQSLRKLPRYPQTL